MAIIGHFLVATVGTVSLDFLIAAPSDHRAWAAIGPLLWNSIYILVLTLLITVPLGASSAASTWPSTPVPAGCPT